jgi:hypothetical protein
MRDPTHIRFRAALFSWIAALLLGMTVPAHGQTTAPQGTTDAARDLSVAPPQPAVMRFKRYVVVDNQGFQGMPFLRGIMPMDWTVQGGVLWKPGLRGLVLMGWADAQDLNGFAVYPSQHFRDEGHGPHSEHFLPGQVVGGFEIQPFPSDQWDVIDRFIVHRYRPDLADATVIQKVRAPEAAKEAYAQLVQRHPAPRYANAAWAGTETFQYTRSGQTVQEMVSVIVEAFADRRLGGGYWAISQASSRRAVNGDFDHLKLISAVIFRSIQMNPAWQQQFNQMVERNQKQQAAQQQQTFDAIENRIRAEEQANDAQHAGYWEHVDDLNRQSENEADIQREVSPWKSSDGNTYKLPTAYDYAWSGADGSIIMNNDPNYDPRNDPTAPSTNWTPMQQTKN